MFKRDTSAYRLETDILQTSDFTYYRIYVKLSICIITKSEPHITQAPLILFIPNSLKLCSRYLDILLKKWAKASFIRPIQTLILILTKKYR